jgi:prepilin-type N-terminal cleavage/methylation domain-containing protein
MTRATERPRRSRDGLTLIEILIVAAVLGIVINIGYTFLRLAGRTAVRVQTAHASVVHAELAMGAVAGDLRSMLPPDPGSGREAYQVGADGRSLSFFRVEEGFTGGLVARPVHYQVRETVSGNGNMVLVRNGRTLRGVLLSRFQVTEHRIEVAGGSGEASPTLPRALALYPRLQISIEGIAEDSPRDEVTDSALHGLSQVIPVPRTSPAATMGLPPAARELARAAIEVEGDLPPAS